jgi:para-nitrobenzyl esterase
LDVSTIITAPVSFLRTAPRGVRSYGSLRHLVADGYSVHESAAVVFAAGRQLPIPMMVGSNARERSPGLTTLPTDLVSSLTSTYGPMADRAMVLYGAPTAEQGRTDPGYGTAIEQWAGDTGFRCDSVLQALWHASAGHAAYQYEFSRTAPGRKAVGAIHGAELWYVFGTLALGAAPAGPRPEYAVQDRAISEAMQTYWTNFAKRGDPNDGALPRWPKFDSSSRSYLQFADSGPRAAEGLRRPFCDLYIENVLSKK